MTSTAAVEAQLRDALTRIRRAWPKPDAVQPRERTHRPAGPRVPVSAAWLARRSVVEDLAFWVQAAREDGLAEPEPGRTVDLGDPADCARHLLPHVRALSGWQYADRMLGELLDAVAVLEQLTRPPKPAVLLGPCPVEVPGADGGRGECGGEVRADVDRASDVRCPQCRTVDTIEGWQRRMVGSLGHVTADRLAEVLRRFGIRTTAAGIRQRVHRKSIPSHVDKDAKGRLLYDAEATLAALMAKEARRAG